MFSILEFAIGAIALAWLIMLAGIVFFYVKIDKEEHDISLIKAKIDFHEESLKKITGSFIALKGEQRTV